MKKRFVAAAVLTLMSSSVFAKTVLTVQYPYGEIFDGLHKKLEADFEAQNPDIDLKFRSNYVNYEDASQKVMREAMTKQLPDVTFQGLNRILPLVDRNIAVPLDDFLTAEDRTVHGFDDSMMAPARFGDKTYALPFAVSLPVVYFNQELVEKATGSSELPTSWAEIMQVSKRINALDGKAKGLYYDWNITGNWLWMSLVMSQGGDIIKDGKVGFDSPEGAWAINKLAEMHNNAGMPDYQRRSAEKSFGAGNIGVYVTSTSNVAYFERIIGDKFTLKTTQFPDVAENGSLPVGGNSVVMLTKDKVKQAAAWKYIKFITGPVGNQQVPHFTGYIPPNQVANKNLGDFYDDKPNHLTALSQLHWMDTWVAYPGRNGLKITDVIADEIQSIVSGKRADEPQQVLKEMTKKVNRLL